MSTHSATTPRRTTSTRGTERPWTNWARTETASPARREAPRDEAELAHAVSAAARAGLHVRAVGAGHSFTGAAVTDGLMLSLDAMRRVHAVVPQDDGTTLVTVDAGTRLHDLNETLARLGLAMRNLGDIAYQSVAGAISTGTHGTGARLGGLATQVRGVRVVGADGTVRDATASLEPELFEASRLGLGQTGILSTVTLEVVPAYLLRAREVPLPLDDVLARLDGPDGLVESTDHFELYWFPGTTTALTKQNNRLGPDDDPTDRSGTPTARLRRWLERDLVENGVLGAFERTASLVPAMTPRLNRILSGAISARDFVAPSDRVFVSPRRVRFREMEYAIPRHELVPVLREIDAWLRTTGEPVPFPVEVRFAASDDVWLSTAQGRETAYVAVHQYARMDHARYFAAVEAIMARVDGRPHWGKMHTLDAERLGALYPRFEDFRRVRTQHDPEGVFANPYTDRVLGPR